MARKDDSTLKEKVALRRVMLRQMKKPPVILEAYGGLGHIWAACYSAVPGGVVFEKKADRSVYLAQQRPTWAVYEADCIMAMIEGAGGHLTINVLDVDPYGDPWPAIAAFFESDRPRVGKLFVVVNDGLRQKVRMGGAWSCDSLRSMVERYGNDLHGVYLEVCREMMKEQAAKAGYTLAAWTGYYCGHAKQMTHYLAVLQR